MRIAIVALLFVIACKGKQPAGTGSAAGSGSAVAVGSGSAGSAAGSDTGSAAGSDVGSGAGSAASFVPAKLGEKDGVVFTEKPGGTAKVFADGTVVEVVKVKDMMVGSEETGAITVKRIGGASPVMLPADRVLIEDALTRSSDGKYVVFAPIVTCGDFCHSIVWFIGADGRRAKLGDGGPGVTVAYSPDGKTVAVGSAGLWVVTLADFKVKAFDGYMSPAYGPDGTLYVRNHGGSAFKLDGAKPKQVWKAEKMSEEDEEMYASEEPRPVQFKDGKPVFDEPWWAGPGGPE